MSSGKIIRKNLNPALKSDLKYLKNPMTYLNSKMWKDIEETDNILMPKKELKEIDLLRSCGINI